MLERIARGSRFASLIGAGLLAAGAAYAADPIKLGVLEDQSGDFALATIGKVHGISWLRTRSTPPAALPGASSNWSIYDTQSDNTRYQEFMRRVLQRDKVDVVFAGFSSASREAVPADRRSARRLCLLQQSV